jgi:hypothetical protein
MKKTELPNQRVFSSAQRPRRLFHFPESSHYVA